MLGDWFKVHPQVREEFNVQNKLTFEWMHDMVRRLKELGGGVPLYRDNSTSQHTASNGLAASSA
jgi:tRNA-dihydrouridine synthase 1